MLLRKRHFLLLEVMIAFALIVMCILPLIYPHTFILTSQRKFIHKVDLDHQVNRIYADIVERLYRNGIPWNDIISGTEFEVNDLLLQRLKLEKKTPL